MPGANRYTGKPPTFEPAKEAFTQDNVSELASGDGNELKGAPVNGILGKVFQVQREDGGLAIQLWTDPENNEGEVIVVLPPETEVKEDEYAEISGTVESQFEGENGFGVPLSILRINGTSYERAEAPDLDPPTSTLGGKTDMLGATTIKIRKVEIAEGSTRVYVRFTNNGSEDFTDTTPSVVAGGEEVEQSYDFSEDYKDPSSSISPGASSSGVLVFEPVTETPLRITFSGFNDNFDEVKTVFTFDE